MLSLFSLENTILFIYYLLFILKEEQNKKLVYMGLYTKIKQEDTNKQDRGVVQYTFKSYKYPLEFKDIRFLLDDLENRFSYCFHLSFREMI